MEETLDHDYFCYFNLYVFINVFDIFLWCLMRESVQLYLLSNPFTFYLYWHLHDILAGTKLYID